MEKRGRPFEVGNKLGRGRPRGSRNKRTLAVQELLNGHTEGLVRKALVMALQGDAGSLDLELLSRDGLDSTGGTRRRRRGFLQRRAFRQRMPIAVAKSPSRQESIHSAKGCSQQPTVRPELL
jgi:hypothetical protein